MSGRRSRHSALISYEASVSTAEGPVALLEPRIASSSAVRSTHTVTSAERIDQIAHRYYGDGHQFWRLADQNLPAAPDDLERPGRVLQLPEVR